MPKSRNYRHPSAISPTHREVALTLVAGNPRTSRADHLLVSSEVRCQCQKVYLRLQLHPAVKRAGQPLVATNMSIACHWSHKLKFFVDTGAQVSVLLPTSSDCLCKQGLTLSAVNGSAIATYGTHTLTLNLGLRRTFCWIFVIADVSKPLLIFFITSVS